MSFDAHSLERLAALGRTLPSRLPPPADASEAATDGSADGGPPRRSDRRHRLETEQDPAQLFHALMQASSDGTVPPHLLERLRDLEHQAPPPLAGPPAGSAARTSGPGPQRRRPGRDPGTGTDDALYTAFSQLLLEEEDGD
jgi:hypothetical protein